MLLLLAACTALCVATPQESARLRISQKGLDFAEGVANYMIDIIQNTALGKLKLPKIKGDLFEISDLKINQLSLSKPEFSVVPKVGFKWEQTSAKVKVSGDYAIQTFWWNYGKLTVAADVGVDFVAGVRASAGTFRTNYHSCDLHFNQLDIDLDSSILNWAVSLMENYITPEMKKAVCEELKKVVSTELNEVISDIPHDIPIGDLLDVHFEADADPVFGKYIDVPARVLASQTQGKQLPFHPEPMLDSGSLGEMGCALLSDYTLNTASFIALPAGKIVERVPCEVIPADSAFLNTAYYKTSLPGLYSAHPDSALSLSASNTRYPRVEFDQDLIKVQLPVQVSVVPAGSSSAAVTLAVDLRVEGTVEHDNNKLSGNISHVSHTTTVKSSAIGSVDPVALKTVVDGVLQKGILPRINQEFQKGIVLPVDKYLSIDQGRVEAHDDYLKVCADVTLTDYSLNEMKKVVEEFIKNM